MSKTISIHRLGKTVKIPRGTPFLPKALASAPPKPLKPEEAAERFRSLQSLGNTKPEAYERKAPYNLKEMYQRFEDLYAQYPPASPEVIEAHRRLGYPQHYITALETGNYKIMSEPSVNPRTGKKDWESLKDYWGFDWTETNNIDARAAWDRVRDRVSHDFAKNRGIRIQPLVDLNDAYMASRFLPDVADTVRDALDKQAAEEMVVAPDLMDKVWGEYAQADEDRLADALYDLYKEKETEVRYQRRSALIEWMQARGELDHWDLMDMMPRQRDLAAERTDETGLVFMNLLLPPIEESAKGVQVVPWGEYKEMLREQHTQWLEADQTKALGGTETEAAKLQKRIDSIVNRGRDVTTEGGEKEGSKAAKAVTHGDVVANRDAMEKRIAENMPDDLDRLPVPVQGLFKTLFGDDFRAKYADIRAEVAAKKAKSEKDRIAAAPPAPPAEKPKDDHDDHH